MKKILFLLIFAVLFLGCQTNKELKHSDNMSKNKFVSPCQLGCYVLVKQDGTLWSFGNQQLEEKDYGLIVEVNDDGSPRIIVPKKEKHLSLAQKVGTATDWSGVKVSIGRTHVYAIKKDGTLWKWNRELKYTNAPIKVHQVTQSNEWKSIKVYTSHESADCNNGTFAIKKDDSLWSWDYGYNENGEPINDSTPKQIRANNEWDKFLVRCVGGYALKTDDSLHRFDINRFIKVDKTSEDKDYLSSLLKHFSTMPSKSILIEDSVEKSCN